MRALSFTIIVSSVLLTVALMPAAVSVAGAQGRGIQLSLGLEQRVVHSHFFDYNGGNSQNTWEDYPLVGAKAELGIRALAGGNASLHGGIGLAVFTLGEYDYEVRSNSGKGPSGGTGYEIDLTAQGEFAVTPSLSLLARFGGGYTAIDASGDAALPAPYKYSFSSGYPELFVAGGLQLDIGPKLVVLGLVRSTVADLGSWVDYGTSPTSEGLSSLGFRAAIGIKL